MSALMDAGAPWPGAVAVSGGGDSLALMVLLADWARARKVAPPVALTVDHGLRPEAAAEVRAVVAKARLLGLDAHVLQWSGRKPRADIEAAARVARYRLMGDWCRRHGTGALYVAHNREDQAETFLLRLARGTGLDGLAAMQAVAPYPVNGFEALVVVRPLLDMPRADLRAFLESRDMVWSEDPMNADPRFARVRLRAAWPALEAAGLSAQRITDAAAHLARVRTALEVATGEFLATHGHFIDGVGFLDQAALAAVPREIGLRALAAALGRVSGAIYRPRFARLERLYDVLLAGILGKGRTLQGCRIRPAPRHRAHFGPSTLMIVPESARMEPMSTERARNRRKVLDNGRRRPNIGD